MKPITYATAQILRVLPRKRITRAMGRLSDYAWPESVGRAVVDLYCRAYHVELDECAKASGFSCFDEFFTRERRVAIAIDTPEVRTEGAADGAEGAAYALGRVTVVMVAAMVVGRITVVGIEERDVPFGHHRFEEGTPVAQGDEIGIFRLG